MTFLRTDKNVVPTGATMMRDGVTPAFLCSLALLLLRIGCQRDCYAFSFTHREGVAHTSLDTRAVRNSDIVLQRTMFLAISQGLEETKVKLGRTGRKKNTWLPEPEAQPRDRAQVECRAG